MICTHFLVAVNRYQIEKKKREAEIINLILIQYTDYGYGNIDFHPVGPCYFNIRVFLSEDAEIFVRK